MIQCQSLRCAVIVCSDSVANGSKQDSSGKCILEKLAQHHLSAEIYNIIPDDFDKIQDYCQTIE
jgi:molybdopterin biosynthesis enzyme MoaB